MFGLGLLVSPVPSLLHIGRGYLSGWDAHDCVVFLPILLKHSTSSFQISLVCQNIIDWGAVLTPVAVVKSFTSNNLYWRFSVANVLSDDTQYRGNAQADVAWMHEQHAVPNPSDSFTRGWLRPSAETGHVLQNGRKQNHSGNYSL